MHSNATCFLSIGLSVFTCAHSSQHNQHTTTIEWTQTGTVYCHIWRALCKHIINQIHASLFHLAFCFHKHITHHIVAFTLAASNRTLDTSKKWTVLYCAQCFSNCLLSIIFIIVHKVLCWFCSTTMRFKQENENEMKRTKTRLSFHHSLSVSDTIWRFKSLSLFTVFDITFFNS